jgi:hypothetical protein
VLGLATTGGAPGGGGGGGARNADSAERVATPSDQGRGAGAGAGDGATGVAIDVGRAGVLHPSSAEALPLTKAPSGSDDSALDRHEVRPSDARAQVTTDAVRAHRPTLHTLIATPPRASLGTTANLRYRPL